MQTETFIILQIDNNAKGNFYLPFHGNASNIHIVDSNNGYSVPSYVHCLSFKLREDEGHAREVWELLLEMIQRESSSLHEAGTQICTGL